MLRLRDVVFGDIESDIKDLRKMVMQTEEIARDMGRVLKIQDPTEFSVQARIIGLGEFPETAKLVYFNCSAIHMKLAMLGEAERRQPDVLNRIELFRREIKGLSGRMDVGVNVFYMLARRFRTVKAK